MATYLRSHSKGQSCHSSALQFQASPQRRSAGGRRPPRHPWSHRFREGSCPFPPHGSPSPPLPLCPLSLGRRALVKEEPPEHEIPARMQPAARASPRRPRLGGSPRAGVRGRLRSGCPAATAVFPFMRSDPRVPGRQAALPSLFLGLP